MKTATAILSIFLSLSLLAGCRSSEVPATNPQPEHHYATSQGDHRPRAERLRSHLRPSPGRRLPALERRCSGQEEIPRQQRRQA